jgi:hypothetical protein
MLNDFRSDQIPMENQAGSMGTFASRVVRTIGWDGVLPPLVASAPLVVKTFFPNANVAKVLVITLVPAAAAMIRAHFGVRQIARVCGGRVPFFRQIGMAGAIVLLLLFEGSVGILTFSEDLPAEGWCFPIGFYSAYVAVIAMVLWPASDKSPRSLEPSN